jgi:hypothetical protein
MSIKEGSKMLYCKVAGDKSSEEVVDVISVHSESAGGGVTIFIPSLKRERDTDISRLAHIVEKKAKIDNYFGKPRLELPEISQEVIIRAPTQRCTPDGKNPICLQVPKADNWEFSATYTFNSVCGQSHLFGMGTGTNLLFRPGGDSFYAGTRMNTQHDFFNKCHAGVPINISLSCSKERRVTTSSDFYKFVICIDGVKFHEYESNDFKTSEYVRIGSAAHATGEGLDALVENVKFTARFSYEPHVDSLLNRDEVLLDNQRLLFNQVNALQETIKLLQRKTSPPPADEELQREIAELRKMNAHHRQMNNQLLASQREMHEEMRQMREEMMAMQTIMKTIMTKDS